MIPKCSSLLIVVVMLCSALHAENAVTDRERARLVATFTDTRRPIHQAAKRAMVSIGAPMLPALEVLAADPDDAIRARVVGTVAEIGGDRALKLLLSMLDDRSRRVREVTVIGLGTIGDPSAYEAIRRHLRHADPVLREAAALGLGALEDPRAIRDLAFWPDAGGDAHLLQVQPGPKGDRQLKRIRVSMQAALLGLVRLPKSMSTLQDILPKMKGRALEALLEATWPIGDPRLCPVLIQVVTTAHYDARVQAAASLAANGDSRALAELCVLAAGKPGELSRVAAVSLRTLTGYEAGPGKAWSLWWERHADHVAGLAERDAFIASLYDPKKIPSKAELQAFTPTQLMPLVTGLQRGHRRWTKLAWRALRQDDAKRWTPALLQAYDDAEEEAEKVRLTVIMDQLADPAARAGLRERLATLHAAHAEGALLPASLNAALYLATR